MMEWHANPPDHFIWILQWGNFRLSLFGVVNPNHAQFAQALTRVAPENLGNIFGHSWT